MELDRAKAKWEYQFISGLERIGGFGGKADLLNQYNTFLDDPNMFEKDLARHREVTNDSLRKVAAQWIDTDNKLTVRFHPEKSEREAKTLRVRSYAQEFESLERIAGMIATLWELGLPVSALDREPAEFQRCTLEAVNSTARKYARPDGVTSLLIGDWSKIQDGIRQLDLGPIVTVDEEGRPLSR